MLTVSLLACAAWIYLVAFHHGFWRADQRLPLSLPDPSQWPAVTVVIPARNEESSIGACVAALTAQDYPGALRMIVVDDASTDDTAVIARAAGDARLTVLAAPPLTAGWTGKLAALEAGVAAAGEVAFLWFTDADIVHAPQVLRMLVAQAVQGRRDLVSLMVKLHCASVWERLLIPAFIFFFQMLYPFRAANDDRSRIAAAAGGCVLIRRDALLRAGGLSAIRGEVIDDCALARAVKGSGGTLWLGLTEKSRSLRRADTLGPLWHMVQRTAFTQLRHSYLLLAGTVLGLSLIFLAPVLAALQGLVGGQWELFLSGVMAYGLMVYAYAPTLRGYGLPIIAGFLLPLTAALYAAMTIGSAVAHLHGRGGAWKGRHYDTSAQPPNLTKSH